ncbi:MAG: coproporphyrinogen dehydrogenase HemZ [Clostridia bacterium]|nr:coproporphyrinogen dehydrogenase HemZ [Clostridia bacterium]
MILDLDSEINVYYVQTLALIFFPGEKFSPDEEDTPETPHLTVRVKQTETGYTAKAVLRIGDRLSEAEREGLYRPEHYPSGHPPISSDRARKLAVGAAVFAVCSLVRAYRPSWGMLTGVRPSKVAMSFLDEGMSKTRVKKVLNNEYLVIPKKASLAIDVAMNERRLVGEYNREDCSVYISIPFCPSRCEYCSFVSYTSKRLLSLIPDYLTRLCLEIREIFREISRLGLRVRTIYVGGGTPTILTAEQLRVLLSTVAECTDVSLLSEFTVECGRPDTIDAEKLAIAASYGVTRISVNPQSLSEEVLHGIGRAHSAEEFYRAYEIARASGIPVINTDLIAGLPGDSFKTFSVTMDKILELRPENVTVHTFAVKRSADILKRGDGIYSMRGGDVGKCVDYSQIRAQAAGYRPYYMYRQKNTVGNLENVGFALDGTEGLYNIYMMEEIHSIFSAGAGAVTKLVEAHADPETGEIKNTIRRLFNPKYPYEYLGGDAYLEKFAEIEAFYSAL